MTTSKENNNNNNNKDQENRINYESIQTEILLFMKSKIPQASPEEVLTIMSSLLTSMILGTTDMIKDLKNKYIDKEAMALGLLEAITTTVRLTIKTNYEMERLV